MNKAFKFLSLLSIGALTATSKTLTEKKGFEISGEVRWGMVGTSPAGDVNGDGYPDMFLSHNNYLGGLGDEAVLVYGGPTDSLNDFNIYNMTPKQGFRIKSKESQTFHSIASGDVNKDGYSDLFVIVQDNFSRTARFENLYIIFGGPSLTDITVDDLKDSQGIKISDVPFAYSQTVGSAGDINGDGYQDIALGVKLWQGKPYLTIIYGGPSLKSFKLSDMTKEQGVTITDDTHQYGYSDFGHTVTSAGDLNKDGYDDLLVGAVVDTKGTMKNFAYVLYGGKSLANFNVSSMTKEQGFAISQVTKREQIRAIVSAAGDVNGDGYPDILIGSPYEGSLDGAVYLLFGGKSLSDIDLTKLTEKQGIRIGGPDGGIPEFGNGVSSAGDFNGDGFGDIIIGCPGEKVDGKLEAGAAYIVYGGKSLSSFNVKNMAANQGFRLTNPTSSGNQVGNSVSGVGDVNKDGYSDVIISIGAKNGGRGAVYALFGKPNA